MESGGGSREPLPTRRTVLDPELIARIRQMAIDDELGHPHRLGRWELQLMWERTK